MRADDTVMLARPSVGRIAGASSGSAEEAACARYTVGAPVTDQVGARELA